MLCSIAGVLFLAGELMLVRAFRLCIMLTYGWWWSSLSKPVALNISQRDVFRQVEVYTRVASAFLLLLTRSTIMGKGTERSKEVKKDALLSPKEKKAAKAIKKNARETTPIVIPRAKE